TPSSLRRLIPVAEENCACAVAFNSWYASSLVGGAVFRKCRPAEVRACVLETVAANQSSQAGKAGLFPFRKGGRADGRRSRRDLSHPPSLKRVSELEKKGGDAQARLERD
ncbi:hypothetical protein E2320_021978, partial [Naja naja]